jgi:hypothetical protein
MLAGCPPQVGIFSEIAIFIGSSEITSGNLYDFGSVALESEKEVPFTIKNLGTDPLTLRKTDGKAVAIEGTGAAALMLPCSHYLRFHQKLLHLMMRRISH